MNLKKTLLVISAAVVLLGIISAAGCVDSSGSTSVKEHSNLGNTADVIDSVQKLTGDENTVISDLSLNMALGMVLTGADNTCREELETFLNISKEDNLGLNRELLDHYKSLSKTNVSLANSFWFDKEFNLQTAYKDTIKKYFDAEIAQYDFKDEKTAGIINSWCAEKTNNLIKEIVTKEQVYEASNILINTVYLNGEWVEPFEDGNCRTESFKGLKETTDVTMMHSTESTYFENDKATAFKKPYSDGISFIGILPKTEGDFTMNSLDLESLLESKTQEYDVYTGLPAFKTECSMDLADTLKTLGFSNVFSDEADTFDEIGRTTDNCPIKISDIIQKTYIDVNKNGTEAAAATAVIMMKVTSIDVNQKETKNVILNRPFAFLILDESNGQILFAGKITGIKA